MVQFGGDYLGVNVTVVTCFGGLNGARRSVEAAAGATFSATAIGIGGAIEFGSLADGRDTITACWRDRS